MGTKGLAALLEALGLLLLRGDDRVIEGNTNRLATGVLASCAIPAV